MILLTDGENNAGEVDPMQAAELAKKMGVKIYTIGVGTRGSAPVPVRNPFTGRQDIQWVEVNIDEDTLTKIADATGRQVFPRDRHRVAGRDLPARSTSSRRRSIEARHFVDYRELAIQATHVAAWSLPPLVLRGAGAAGGPRGVE